MINNLLITIIAFLSIVSCNAQQNKNIMITEKYNFKAVKNADRYPIGVKRNESIILIYQMTSSGAYQNEYLASPNYYMIQKAFYPNGNIQTVMKIVGRTFAIGESIYYDENGNIIKRVNEDEKLGKIKIEDLLKFIEKEGYIDLEKGKGLGTAFINEDGRGEERDACFDIYGGTFDGEECWTVCIYPSSGNQRTEIIYLIDRDTGEVLSKKSEQKFPIM